METTLYLDTARMGALCPRRGGLPGFPGTPGCGGMFASFEAFLREGIDVWPDSLRERYAGLSDWHGLHAFMETLQGLTHAPAPLDVLLTNAPRI